MVTLGCTGRLGSMFRAFISRLVILVGEYLEVLGRTGRSQDWNVYNSAREMRCLAGWGAG